MYSCDRAQLVLVVGSSIRWRILGSASPDVYWPRSRQGSGAVVDGEGDVVWVTSCPGSEFLGDLEGVGVCGRCCHGDPVGSHDGFDEEEVSVVVGADEDVCFVHVWSFGLVKQPHHSSGCGGAATGQALGWVSAR